MVNSKQIRLAMLAVVFASFLFSTSAAVRALLDFPGTPVSVAAWRVFLGGIFLLAYARIKYGASGIKVLFRLPVVWLMGIATLMYQMAFFFGADRIGVALGTLGALALAPFLSGLLGWAIGTGRPSKAWAISTMLAVIGLALLTGLNGKMDLLGLFAVFMAGNMYAIFTVFGVQQVNRYGITGAEVLAVAFAIGAIFATPVVVATSSWITSASDILLVMYVGIATTALAYIFFGTGISRLSPGTVSTMTLAEPVLATIWGVFLLSEPMTFQGWVGSAVILFALLYLGRAESKDPKGEELGESVARA